MLSIKTNLPDSYAAISKHILRLKLFGKKEVHIIFDKYNTPSSKDYELQLRVKENTTQFNIKRGNKRPADFGKLLQSRNFKEKFVEFLIEDWTNDEFVVLCERKIIKLNYNYCYAYEVSNGKMKRFIDYNCSCVHEEADTKIIHHICQMNANYRVNVHCTDSDIPIIMLANMKFLKADVQITIDMTNVGEKLSHSLAICHVFTGNDFNPYFFEKEKKNRSTL